MTAPKSDKREWPPFLDFAFARIAQHVRDGDGDKAYRAFKEIILFERANRAGDEGTK